jgi:oligopeptidase B
LPGAYGVPNDVGFRAHRLSLLDRGFVFAIAHIRGGGELGRPWYEAGKMLCKRNTFNDFIGCAEYLIEEGYTSNDRLVIEGRSAGGLLIGAVITQAPALARVAILAVPFVDVVTTMLDDSIPLTVIEKEEWGDPANKDYYDYMKSYSPVDNVREGVTYPSIYVETGLADPRVQYWEPLKFVAKLRALRKKEQGDDRLIVLKINKTVGHMGDSGQYKALKEIAHAYAFILNQLSEALSI